jgi:hypothetical protein
MWLRWKSKIIQKGGQQLHPLLPVPNSLDATFSISMRVLGCDPSTILAAALNHQKVGKRPTVSVEWTPQNRSVLLF